LNIVVLLIVVLSERLIPNPSAFSITLPVMRLLFPAVTSTASPLNPRNDVFVPSMILSSKVLFDAPATTNPAMPLSSMMFSKRVCDVDNPS